MHTALYIEFQNMMVKKLFQAGNPPFMPKKECYYESAMFRYILIGAPQTPPVLDHSFLSLTMRTDIAQARREK